MKGISGALVFSAVVCLAAVGCAKPETRCASPGDNPGSHYLAGMDLLEKGRADEAIAKFDRAVWCDEKYAPAHAGEAIAWAMKAADVKNEDLRGADKDKVYGHLRAALKNSSSPEDEFSWRLATMRAKTSMKEYGWIADVKKSFKGAARLKVNSEKLPYYRQGEAAAYFMGAAYLEAGDFADAAASFRAVLDSRAEGKWLGPADSAWKRADKIVRAASGVTLGEVGKKIALLGAVKRADLAALMVDELKADRLFAGRIPVRKAEPDYTPADVLSNPFMHEITVMLKWNIRGFEPQYDQATRAYLFRPDEPVKRKELALALEDIVIKLAGDEKLGTAFMGHQKSPFPDIEPASAWYNAAMTVTTRNIMETGLSGEFRPDEAVDGAEAVMAIRSLKHQLNLN